jgi:hypothetical protein
MTHPFERLSPAQRRTLFFSLLSLALLLLVGMNFIGLPLNTPAAPQGVVSFEFAGTPARARAMLDSWDASARVRLGFIQGLDFLFPLAYSSAVGMGCLLAAGVLQRRGLPGWRWGRSFAWGQWAAALFDYVENIALVALLFGAVSSPLPQIAFACAALKFVLLGSGLVYAFFGLAMRVVPAQAGD